MSSIQLSNSSYHSNTFGIQSAATAFHQRWLTENHQSGILYTHGCNDIEPPNCTTACQDPVQIFKSPYTLQNCMVMSALVPSNWMQPNETTLLLSDWTQPLSTKALGVAFDFGIDTTSWDFPSLASNVTRTIKDCLGQYCEFNQNCPTNETQDGINPDLVMFWPWFWDYDWANLTASSPVYNMTCPSGGALNPDIGGIGVGHGYTPPVIKSPPELILE